jgi:3-methyladenine DNA glycosylase AlkD
MKHLMDAIEQWSKQASKEAWTQVLAMLVQKTYACRNDKVYTAIWKCISTHIGSDTDLMRIVTTACVDTMEQQPR